MKIFNYPKQSKLTLNENVMFNKEFLAKIKIYISLYPFVWTKQ